MGTSLFSPLTRFPDTFTKKDVEHNTPVGSTYFSTVTTILRSEDMLEVARVCVAWRTFLKTLAVSLKEKIISGDQR